MVYVSVQSAAAFQWKFSRLARKKYTQRGIVTTAHHNTWLVLIGMRAIESTSSQHPYDLVWVAWHTAPTDVVVKYAPISWWHSSLESFFSPNNFLKFISVCHVLCQRCCHLLSLSTSWCNFTVTDSLDVVVSRTLPWLFQWSSRWLQQRRHYDVVQVTLNLWQGYAYWDK